MEMTCLGGALHRVGLDTWVWCDRTPEPLVRDLHLRALAPNWRCITHSDGTTYVEVPWDWHDIVRDSDVGRAVARLVAEYPQERPIYAGGLDPDDHRATDAGYLVPILAWDLEMAVIVGAEWDEPDEAHILATARWGRRCR